VPLSLAGTHWRTIKAFRTPLSISDTMPTLRHNEISRTLAQVARFWRTSSATVVVPALAVWTAQAVNLADWADVAVACAPTDLAPIGLVGFTAVDHTVELFGLCPSCGNSDRIRGEA